MCLTASVFFFSSYFFSDFGMKWFYVDPVSMSYLKTKTELLLAIAHAPCPVDAKNVWEAILHCKSF